MKYWYSLAALIIWFCFSCGQKVAPENPVQAANRPNILWLVAEDLSPYIPSFGDSTVVTPNLSRLAAEGVRFTNVYSVSGVCAPSRAAIATGMYPSSIGAHHMRTLPLAPAAREMGLIDYECVPPPEVKMVSQILRKNGYYCSNNAKQDYQFRRSLFAWDESGIYAHWRNRPDGKAFYSVFNFGVTHESQTWNPRYQPYDLETFPPERTGGGWGKAFRGKHKPLSVPDDLEVPIPPYLPKTIPVINDVRRMYSNIVDMDRQVGKILKQLENDGLLENTVIVWYTDHGGPLPRQKRLLYDSGLRVPMIIRYPQKQHAGTIDDQLISFVDFAPALLSMAGIEPPGYMQGRAFTGKFSFDPQRNYIHAAADRFDEEYDMIRAVRDGRFKYLRNFNPNQGYYLPLAYREKMATMQELLRLRDAGALNEEQMLWFRNVKPEEELFDISTDPHELNNLAQQPEYKKKLEELRRECNKWMDHIQDKGHIPETELIKSFWPGKQQPKTQNPTINQENGIVLIYNDTKGASSGYLFMEEGTSWKEWTPYVEPFKLEEQTGTYFVVSHRLGYAPSDTIRLE